MLVEQGAFSFSIFSIYDGMGREYQAFYSRLSKILVDKGAIHKSVMMHSVRSNLSYALLRSCLLCLRGSCLQNRNISEVEQDIEAQYEL